MHIDHNEFDRLMWRQSVCLSSAKHRCFSIRKSAPSMGKLPFGLKLLRHQTSCSWLMNSTASISSVIGRSDNLKQGRELLSVVDLVLCL